MFGGKFNHTPFNRSVSLAIYGSFVADLGLNIDMFGRMEMRGGFDIEISPELLFELVRKQLGAFVINLTSDVNFAGMREHPGRFELLCELDIKIEAGRTHVDIIEFTGEFKPGDQIVIDSQKLRFTLNGENALHLMDGDFFDLNTGGNELIYTDDQTGRTVRMRITFKDRYV